MNHWTEEPREGFDRITSAIDEIREGGMVVVVDDEDRENEGDIIFAAERCTTSSPAKRAVSSVSPPSGITWSGSNSTR